MPLFNFRCRACGHEAELLVRPSEAPSCPSCGAGDLERLVSLVAPQGKSGAVLKSARSAAAKEGHFSNYAKAERKGL